MPIQKRVSELPAATGVTGSDLLILSSSSATRRVTLATLSGYFGSGGFSANGNAVSSEAYQGATAPAEASAGATWLDTTTGSYFTRYAGVWIEVGGKHYP